MNILLAEDDLHIQALFKSAIEEFTEPITLHVTESSAKAIQISLEQPIDIFIIDIQLADYKGTHLAKELRQLDAYTYTPIIFATALAGEELLAYREIKCFHFLIKPFTKQEIQKVLLEAIDYRKHVSEPPRTIRIEQKGFILELHVDSIMYIESFGKKIEIHVQPSTGDEQVEVISGYSLKRLKELTQDASFIQCHKSYLVNQKYIHKIDKTNSTIQLKVPNRQIPIGKTYIGSL